MPNSIKLSNNGRPIVSEHLGSKFVFKSGIPSLSVVFTGLNPSNTDKMQVVDYDNGFYYSIPIDNLNKISLTNNNQVDTKYLVTVFPSPFFYFSSFLGPHTPPEHPTPTYSSQGDLLHIGRTAIGNDAIFLKAVISSNLSNTNYNYSSAKNILTDPASTTLNSYKTYMVDIEPDDSLVYFLTCGCNLDLNNDGVPDIQYLRFITSTTDLNNPSFNASYSFFETGYRAEMLSYFFDINTKIITALINNLGVGYKLITYNYNNNAMTEVSFPNYKGTFGERRDNMVDFFYFDSATSKVVISEVNLNSGEVFDKFKSSQTFTDIIFPLQFNPDLSEFYVKDSTGLTKLVINR